MDFVNNYDKELEAMNKGKVRRPYQITNSYARFLALIIIRSMLGEHAIQTARGFTLALNRLILNSEVDYSEIRKRLMNRL